MVPLGKRGRILIDHKVLIIRHTLYCMVNRNVTEMHEYEAFQKRRHMQAERTVHSEHSEAPQC